VGGEIGEIMRMAFAEAQRLNFPQFVGPEGASTPINATPYVVSLNDLRQKSALKHRGRLMALLVKCIEDLRELGVDPVAALLGGSAIGPKANPSDLDCVIFYEARRDGIRDFSWMARFQMASKAEGLDLRLIPLDGDPILLIKAISFFSTLYVKNAGDNKIIRGLVLVDCRD
jgi:hypothetical protein